MNGMYLVLYSLFILFVPKLRLCFYSSVPFFFNVVRIYAITTQFLKALNQMASISNELTTLLQAGKWFVCST